MSSKKFAQQAAPAALVSYSSTADAVWTLSPGSIFLPAAYPEQSHGQYLSHALSLASEWESLGFQAEPALIRALSHLTLTQLTHVHAWSIPALRKSLGAHRSYTPMYPHFPKQVMEASDAELWVNAMMHYTGDALGVRILPLYAPKKRGTLSRKDSTPKALRVVFTSGLAALARAWLTMTTAWPEVKTPAIAHVLRTSGELALADWSHTPLRVKENLARVAAWRAQDKIDSAWLGLGQWVSSATDILRMAVAMNPKGDVGLADTSKAQGGWRIGKIPRAIRKQALALLESLRDADQVLEDMQRRREAFLRVGYALHAGEYTRAYPKAAAYFSSLRNASERKETYNALLERAFKTKPANALALLSQRPGVFVRRFVQLWTHPRISEVLRQKTLQAFTEQVPYAATPLLLQFRAFLQKGWKQSHRMSMAKGAMAKAYVRQEVRQPNVTMKPVIDIVTQELLRRFQAQGPLGRVYMDPSARKVMAPYGLRNTSASLKTLPRGSRVALQEDVVRLFMWWKEQGERVDLDLSATLLDAQFGYVEHVSWTNLRSDSMVHSGDITSAPNGACEFLDVCLSRLPKNAKYMVMQVYNYTGQAFEDMQEAYMGWMGRGNSWPAKKGQIFEARAVQQKIDLQGQASVALPLMVDIQSKEIIVLDVSTKSSRRAALENHQGLLYYNVMGLADIAKPTLGDLMDLHIAARGGQWVQDPKQADVVVDWSGDNVLTPYDTATWASTWMQG